MPTRIIRDGILTSERVNALSGNAELFYRRLMSVVDDYGRSPANLMLLRGSCYPLKLDSVKEDSIKKHLAECVDAGLIVLYTVAAKAYLELQDFGQRINGKPKFPGPEEADSQIPGESRGIPGNFRLVGDEDEDVIEDEDVGVGVPNSAAAKSQIDYLLDAYHQLLPGCQRVTVRNDKRIKRINAALALAKRLCKEVGWPYNPEKFWLSYFNECAKDAWMRGEVPNPRNPSWKQNLDVLIAEDRFAGVMDKAISSMRSQA